MSLTSDDIKKIAHLARLNLSPTEIEQYRPQLDNILKFIDEMSKTDTTNVAPLAHPLDLAQPQREDKVTEPDLRDKFQRLAPEVAAGLYLVPKVIE